VGFGFWLLGIGPNPQSPIPNPQSPIPIFVVIYFIDIYINKIFINIYNINKRKKFKLSKNSIIPLKEILII